MSFKNVKDELRQMISNPWGIIIIVSWFLFIVFVFWDMIVMFKASRFIGIYALLGVLDLLLLFYVASYFSQPILAPKFRITRELYYLIIGTSAIALQYIIAMIAAAVPALIINWTYFIILIAEIAVVISTIMINQSRIRQKLKIVEEIADEEGV